MPSHTHSIPALSGSTSGVGNHAHYSGNGYHGLEPLSVSNGGVACISWEHIPSDGSSGNVTTMDGAHSHTVTTNASTTGGLQGGKAHTHTLPDTNSSSNIPLYITCYMWKRTA